MTQGTIEPKEGVTLSRAADGDILIIMDGADMADGRTVEVHVGGGTFEVLQAGTCYARAPAGDEASLLRDLRGAGSIKVMEVYKEPDGDDKLAIHSDVRLSVDAG